MRNVPRIRKLEELRRTARLGLDALDRGEFKEFKNGRDLERYLLALSNRVISKTKSRRPAQ